MASDPEIKVVRERAWERGYSTYMNMYVHTQMNGYLSVSTLIRFSNML